MEQAVLQHIDAIATIVIHVAFGAMTVISCWHYVRRTHLGESEDTEKLYGKFQRRRRKPRESK